jgi:3-hydroxybutyryl-CoA dehydrogenase
MSEAIVTIGVIGAGQMGAGIAQVCATAGYQVRLQDLAEDRLQQAMAGIDSRLGRLVEKQQLAAEGRAATLRESRPAPRSRCSPTATW